MIKKIKGFSDIFPPEIYKYLQMEEEARRIFPLYGFQEIRLPLLEKTEVFARSIGDETDIVQKEMFTFTDRKGRSLSLRPEATAGVVRAYIENRIYTREKLSKFFTLGPMFRYERPQQGRQRQFHQINVEAFGSTSPYLDAEIICMLWEFLGKLKLPHISLEINSLGCEKCRPSFIKALKRFLGNIDKDELCEDCLKRREKNPLRALDCKREGCQALYLQAPCLHDFLCEDCRSHFELTLSLLEQRHIPYKLNKKLVRGLDYYQKTTFEVLSGDIGAQSAIAGGGRYDGLVRLLGGPDVPGIGFACGMERISLLMEDPSPSPPLCYLAPLEEKGLEATYHILSLLRGRGISCISTYEVKSIKAHLRAANKIGSRYVLILGEEELRENKITIRDLTLSRQDTIAMRDIHITEFKE